MSINQRIQLEIAESVKRMTKSVLLVLALLFHYFKACISPWH